jgi:NADH-quinone oxidoreductase subunit J
MMGRDGIAGGDFPAFVTSCPQVKSMDWNGSITTADAIFLLFGAGAVLFAVLAVSLRHVFYCALALIGLIFCTSGLFVLLGAGFLAAVQILVYVGAIVVLFLFSIVLTERIASRSIKQTNEQKGVSALVAVIVFGVVAYISARGHWPAAPAGGMGTTVNVIGRDLLTTYLAPFEVASVLLLAALVGAVVLGRERIKK